MSDCEPLVLSCEVTVELLVMGESAAERVTLEVSVWSELESDADDVFPLLVDVTARTLPADCTPVVSVVSKVSVPDDDREAVVRLLTEAPSAVVPVALMVAPDPPDQFVVPDWLLDIDDSEWLLPSASVQSCCE